MRFRAVYDDRRTICFAKSENMHDMLIGLYLYKILIKATAQWYFYRFLHQKKPEISQIFCVNFAGMKIVLI